LSIYAYGIHFQNHLFPTALEIVHKAAISLSALNRTFG